ncbi:MAG: hypothetical protein WA667_18930 [Candidatus Nitrosopolaris sp.]
MTDNKLDVTVMLLGSGQQQYLDHRKQVRTQIIESGIKNVVIMEEETDKLEDISLDDKFRRITNEQNPELYIAFFHNGAPMDGVTFELGWLCCKYHEGGLNERLRILTEKGYNWHETTAYVPSLIPKVLKNEFDDSEPYSKASAVVSKWALNFVLGKKKRRRRNS